MFTLAEAAQSQRGWGGPVALLIAVVAFLAFAGLHYAWHERRGLPSPTEDGDTDTGVNTQVSEVSDTDDTDHDTGWWGRIVEVGGRRVRAGGPAPRDPVVDVALDEDDEPEEEPATIEEVVATMLDRGHPYAEIVRHVMDEFEVSEATAKRRIRDVRAERIAAAG